MQDTTPDNVTPFASSEVPSEIHKNPLPDYPNGKLIQILTAARERFDPPISDAELAEAEKIVKENPDQTYEAVASVVGRQFDLETRKKAWEEKEDKLVSLIDDMAAVVKKHNLFPLASPTTVAAYLFHAVQGLTMITYDLFNDAAAHGEGEEPAAE